MPPKRPTPSRQVSRQPARTLPETVDPRWILKALAVVLAVAAVCAYASVCGLFYYGQWQLVLQPSRDVKQTPATYAKASNTSVTFSEVHFGPDSTGQPQLDGWWIPSDLPTDPTVLVLHAGSGSMSDALPAAMELHDTRLNVLLFDYRGFGHSGAQHPTEISMEQDSDAALSYLIGSQHMPASSIIVYGNGVGASLAARLCEQHRDLAAMILESADGDFASRAEHDPRARMVPASLLFHETFPLADRLHTLAIPKLLISWTDAKTPPADYSRAADPKMTVEIRAGDTQALHESLRRFLDSYITHPAATLSPNK